MSDLPDPEGIDKPAVEGEVYRAPFDGHITGEQMAESIRMVEESDQMLSLKTPREKRLEELVRAMWTHKGHRGSNANFLAQINDEGLRELLQEVLPDWTTWR